MSDAVLVRRTLLISALVVAVAALCALVALHPEIPLFAFGGIFGAVALDALARPLLRFGAPRIVAIPVAVAVLLAVAVGGALLMGPQLAEQGRELLAQLPELLDSARSRLLRSELGGEQISAALESPEGEALLRWERIAPYAFGSVAGFFGTAAGVITGTLAIFTLALFLALQPELYREGALRLLPRVRREPIRALFDQIAVALRGWILARLAAMAAVAALTALGLWLLDIPLALTLGVIAGVLAAIPYLGPILGAVPALVVALATGLQSALFVAILYTGIQLLENNVLTPVIEGKAISLPPALLIVAQLGLGTLLGVLGLLAATPLLVAAMVTVQVLYVQRVIGEPVQVLGESEEEGAGAKPPGGRRRSKRGDAKAPG
jgi:predicted PurR-regulated permease PerM